MRKTYLAKVLGHPSHDRFICEAPISAEPQEGGLRVVDRENGLSARTEVQVLRRNADGTSWLEVRPISGRTNQIRLHLKDAGFPICGDRTYGDLDGDLVSGSVPPQTNHQGDEPLHLHAWKISLRHPRTEGPVSFEAPLPAWAESLRVKGQS